MTATAPTTALTDTTTDAELDALATAGALRPVGAPDGGGPITDEDGLRALLGGRPNLGSPHAAGASASARRQVRLPERLSTALDDYAAAHTTTPSAVIRDALAAYLDAA